MSGPKREFRLWKQGPIRFMGEAEGYVMVRRPGAMVFVLSRKEWNSLPAVPPKEPEC